MKRLFSVLLGAVGIISCGFVAHRPKGELTYCSYRCCGAAGLGTDYCELIAEPGRAPEIVVVLDDNNRFDRPVIRRSYPVDRHVVGSLARILASAKVYRLDGYNLKEPICGGRSYSFDIAYSSGDKVHAYWYGHHVKDKARAAYYLIEEFFAPWRRMAGESD